MENFAAGASGGDKNVHRVVYHQDFVGRSDNDQRKDVLGQIEFGACAGEVVIVASGTLLFSRLLNSRILRLSSGLKTRMARTLANVYI